MYSSVNIKIIGSHGSAWPQGTSRSGSRCGTDGFGRYKTYIMGDIVWDGLEARRSFFPDWLWLHDESSPHRRALHIPVQILTQIGVPDNIYSYKSIPCSTGVEGTLL